MLVLAMAMLGMGNGAVFQLVPQRFAGRVGIITGIVGAAGGLGGFLLPSLLGSIKDRAGTFGLGFAVIAAAMLSGAAAVPGPRLARNLERGIRYSRRPDLRRRLRS
jgi:MFS transporter, NNP family, nitrate/nitrite transporter